MISIQHCDKADVLCALYNASKVQGLGFLHFTPEPLTRAEAAQVLAHSTYVDYLKGRVMKIDLSSDSLNPSLYDRDNGSGACLRALQAAGLAVEVQR